MVLVVGLVFIAAGPKVKSFAGQAEIFDLVTNGRYLVLFQNDAEIRPTGGFIGSFAIIEAKRGAIKPLYFETNIYKLDDPFSKARPIEPPKPLQAAIGDRGWAMRDSNFAADFRQSAPTILWFLKQEINGLTGPKKVEIDQALGGDYHLDGVIATTLTAFLDILAETGPIVIPANNVTVNKDNFFPIVQSVVERDYFKDPANVVENEPKTILQNLFPLALAKTQNMPKTTQYRLAKRLLAEKKVLIYTNNAEREEILVKQGWAGALDPADDLQLDGPNDFLAVIRSSHGGNKSSIDINPIYRYSVDSKNNGPVKVRLELTYEHTGTGEWPGGVSREYVRVLAPKGATLTTASKNGDNVLDKIDVGQEMDRAAFGFWLHTLPKTNQSITLHYDLPREAVLASSRFGPDRYRLHFVKQPGGRSPDLSVIENGKVLYQGRLTEDRIIQD